MLSNKDMVLITLISGIVTATYIVFGIILGELGLDNPIANLCGLYYDIGGLVGSLVVACCLKYTNRIKMTLIIVGVLTAFSMFFL